MIYPREILVLRLGGIGEVLAITPALGAIRTRFPQATITIVAESPSYQIVTRARLVDRVILANRVTRAAKVWHFLSPRFYGELLQLIESLTRTKYDLFLDFQHLYYRRSIFKPLMIGLLSRASERVGFDSYGRGFFLTRRVPDPRMLSRHLIYRNKEFLASIGIELLDPQPEWIINEEEDQRAYRLLAGLGIDSNHKLIGISPGSSRPATRWHLDRFAILIRKILENFPVKVILIGNRHEYNMCERIIDESGKECINLAGQTELGELGAVLKRLRLFISNDTGPLHIAYALKVPTIGIFRPGEYPIWGSYQGLDRFTTLYRQVWCAPCYRYTCRDHICMDLIEVEDVFREVKRFLEKLD
jgi:ADP-heptose:LPS heptosyltransferase